MTARAGDADNVRKFEQIFERRLEKGQHHSAPFLGCREFAAAVEPARETPAPIDLGVDRPLGWIFYDFDWSGFEGHGAHRESQPRMPLFFNARLTDGVMHVPPRTVARRVNGEPQ
jgi:CRISPR-associated protein Cas5d